MNPAGEGTKAAGLYVREIPAAGQHHDLRPAARAGPQGPSGFTRPSMMFSPGALPKRMPSTPPCSQPSADEDMRRIQRQAFAGMLWSKQFYNLDVQRWLDGASNSAAAPREPEARAQR